MIIANFFPQMTTARRKHVMKINVRKRRPWWHFYNQCDGKNCYYLIDWTFLLMRNESWKKTLYIVKMKLRTKIHQRLRYRKECWRHYLRQKLESFAKYYCTILIILVLVWGPINIYNIFLWFYCFAIRGDKYHRLHHRLYNKEVN